LSSNYFWLAYNSNHQNMIFHQKHLLEIKVEPPVTWYLKE
jgi:hypothetical protein